MVLYMNCANYAPGVKFGHTLGVDSLHRLNTIGKHSNSLLERMFPLFCYFKMLKFQVTYYKIDTK